MARSRVVRPETKRLEISDGDWVLVKRRLNSGEQRRQFARIYQTGATGRMVVDPLQTGLALIVSYLLDWSLIDEQGKVIDIRDATDEQKIAAVDALDYASFVEIKTAIEQHQDANEQETAEKKMTPTGAPSSEPSSPSLVGADGATSGSEN